MPKVENLLHPKEDLQSRTRLRAVQRLRCRLADRESKCDESGAVGPGTIAQVCLLAHSQVRVSVSHLVPTRCTLLCVTSLPLKVWMAAVLGLAVLGHTLPAGASREEAFTLSWQAPSDCPSPGDVRAAVARLLGGEIRLPAGQDLKATALVAHGPIWSVAIETNLAGRPGRRSIEAASCQDLADATALILALTIDPDVVATKPARPKPPPPLPPSPLPPPPVPMAARPAAPKHDSRTDFLFGLHAQGSQGTLPSVDVGLGGSVGIVGRRYRVELRGAYGLRRDQIANAATPPGAFGRFNFWAGVLAGCLNFGQEALAFGPCVDAEAGVVSAQGFGVSKGFQANKAWLALGAGGYAAISLGPRWAVPLHLDVLAPLVRPEFVFQNVPNHVFQAPAAGVRVSLGIELHF